MTQKKKTLQGLVGDIGGTNARFALVTRTATDSHLDHITAMQCEDFDNVQAVLKAYFKGLVQTPQIDFVVLAIAGPVKDGAIKVTNLDWVVTETDLKLTTGAKTARLINDYAALSYCLPHLKPADIHQIGPVSQGYGHVHAVMGAGTGFGASVLVSDGGHPLCLSTESGHATYAPTNDFETQIHAILRKKYGRVTIEHILSGPGLVNLYKAIAQINGDTALGLSPAEITDLDGPDSKGCRQTVDSFLDILASVCGDLALYHGATSGMSIAGGIVPRLIPVMDAVRFRARMEAKAPLQSMVAAIPSRVITYPYAALMGAAHALGDHEI